MMSGSMAKGTDRISISPARPSQWRKADQWLPGVFFWSFQVALTSAAFALTNRTATREGSLGRSLITWGVWALLAPLIVGLDRWLPLSREAIFKRFVLHIPFSLVFTALNLYIDTETNALLHTGAQPFPLPQDVLARAFQSRFFVYWMLLLIYLLFDYATNLRQREVRTAELERLLSQARLEALRAKLHPHFLFNTLNTISAKVEREPRTARRMIEQLGELLRISMSTDNDQDIPLMQELTFIERYLDLQKIRFEERLDTSVDIEPGLHDALVPTFILQPLVENAIRYGTAACLDQSVVEVRAWQEDGRLRLQVEDNGPGLPPGWEPENQRGLGIASTRERLRRLYGDRERTFEIHSEPGKGVRVDVSIPLRRSRGLTPEQVEDYGEHSRISG
jgi:two-component system LytT family sensor kinase